MLLDVWAPGPAIDEAQATEPRHSAIVAHAFAHAPRLPDPGFRKEWSWFARVGKTLEHLVRFYLRSKVFRICAVVLCANARCGSMAARFSMGARLSDLLAVSAV